MEGAYGSAGTMPALNQASDSLLIYDNANPIAVDKAMVDIIPLRASLSPTLSLIGRSLHRYTGVTYMQGPENFVTGLPWRSARLMRACGVQEIIANNSSILYYPRSSGFESVALSVWPDGWRHDMLGVYGNFTLDADAGQGLKMTMDMMGLFPTATPIQSNQTLPAQTLEVNKARTWKNAGVVITGGAYTITGGKLVAGGFAISGGTALVPVAIVKHFDWTPGAQVAERPDANAVNALYGLIQGANTRQTVLNLTIEVDSNPNLNPFNDWENATTHAVQFSYTSGTGPGSTINFLFPYCQITNVVYGDDNGQRTFQLTYKPQTQTAGQDDEWQIRMT